MSKAFIILIGFLFIHPAFAAEKKAPVPEEGTIGTFLYNLEGDQEKGAKLEKKHEKQEQEKRLKETEKESEKLMQRDESAPE